MIEPRPNIVAFKPRARRAGASSQEPSWRRIYAAGSLSVRADDVATKMAAVMLQALGFLVIEEILADGTPRRLAAGEARQAIDRPWRLSKPAFGDEVGRPDAGAPSRVEHGRGERRLPRLTWHGVSSLSPTHLRRADRAPG